ncbi:mannose-1-phosphate guanylyltransferase [Flavobacterium sp. UMI-01]|uniref:mannose-1-phosphate guanylyltransferase n=1 Tax=Flavobacterium sp. UMI-01 TaxID=1441053 RepID=UPI001C7D40FD|nr:sugar phosphate nucleotidyltransferase [Flavobacterium sp. UMI-01]GIZ07423.1 hypothetical protein FUMI01_01500 [Flavobacterium sp. UMI-01]
MEVVKNKVTHVVLTGGIGSRLWPLSRKSKPKQYLEIFEGKSLFELTVERNQAIAQNTIVVGNIDNCHLSKKAMDKNTIDYFEIIEATPRNTAAAIAFAAFASLPDDILLITPSDHIIDGEQEYKKAIDEAILKASEGNIVTFGIVPNKPETGYGYIEQKGDAVLSFREKPNYETAVDFINKGVFLWNSGMFCFKASVYLEELKKYQPEVYEKSKVVWENNNDGKLDYELSMEIPSISVDYAVMERSKKIKVVSAKFKWSDLGSFESVYDYLLSKGYPSDKNGNITIGDSKHTTFVGLRDIIFVCTEDANLILKKKHSQEVKEVYDSLNRQKSPLLD